MSVPSPPHVDRLRSIGAGDTLGHRLVLGRVVGAGGMGRVHEAIDESSGRRLAVKLIQTVRDDADAARFTAEAEVLEALDHPAIVAYVGHGTTPAGDHYLAMQWLDGEHLGQRLEREPLTVADAIALGRRLAAGLAAAHAAGVVHRDLKPGNIVLVDGDVARATLVDFGIARRPGADSLTRTGDLLGTPGYMAPEQARGRRDVDGRADLFALGCVLYHALAGRPPFEADEVMTVLARLLLEDPPRLRARRAEVPARLERLIARLLAKEPGRRPATASAVDDELAAIAAGGTSGRAARVAVAAAAVAAVAAGVAVAVAGRAPAPATRPAPAPAPPQDPERELQRRVDDALAANPGARQLGPGAVELQPGVVMTLPRLGEAIARGAGDEPPIAGIPACPDGAICLYTEPGFAGARLAFDRCGTYNLYWLWMSPERRWNDLTSSWARDPRGFTARMYDWDGVSAWLPLFRTDEPEDPYVGAGADERSDLLVTCP